MILSVASGKGGTGKTLVATSLALSLEGQMPVQLLDCDVEEPNAHILLRPQLDSSQPVTVPVPVVDKEKCTYCGLCSEACVYNAIAVAGAAPRAVKKLADPKPTVILDAPPGTSCPVVETVRGSDFCLLVTEPTPFGLSDLTIAGEVAREIGVPFGVIINRDGLGNDGVERYCAQEGIPLLMRIPFDRRIAEAYCRGETLAAHMPSWRHAVRDT